MQQYDPQTYGYYQYDKGLKAQGQQIVQGLTSQLNNYNQLISSSDPNAILADFNNKMQNIESLEQNYLDQSFQFGQQRGNELAGQLNSGDYMGAFTNAINTIGTMSEMKRAEEQLAAQKAALAEQRRQKMSEVYWKAIEFNNRMIEEYMKRAAFAEDLPTEQYNLAFVEHLECYEQQMQRRWNSTSTSWLTNNCSKPVQPNVTEIENKFIPKDVQIKNIARRKMDLFAEIGNTAFLDAAIGYAAKATETNPSAENYYYLSDLYRRKSTLLAYATMLTAREISPSYFDEYRMQILSEVKEEATQEVAVAIKDNDTAYLRAFLAARLDRSIKIDGKTLLSEAIQLDQPDALQLILNQYIDGLSQDKINAKVQQVVMLCAIQNAPNCLSRFIKLQVPVEFTLKGYTPIDVAVKAYAPDSYKVLLENSSQRSYYEGKHGQSVTQIMLNSMANSGGVAQQIDGLSSNEASIVAQYLVSKITDSETALTTLARSQKTRNAVNTNPILKREVIKQFIYDLTESDDKGRAAIYIETGLLAYPTIPTMNDLKEEIKVEKKVSIKDPFTTKQKIEELLRVVEKTYANLEAMDFSTEGKDEHINSIQKLKAKSTLSKEESNYLTAILLNDLIDLALGRKKNSKVLKGYYDYFKQNVEPSEPVSTRKKISVMIRVMEELSPYASIRSFEGELSLYREYLQDPQSQTAVPTLAIPKYIIYAWIGGEPIDAVSIEYLSPEWMHGFSPAYSVQASNSDVDLASLAFATGNTELFAALDKQYDLSMVRTQSGLSLKQVIFDGQVAVLDPVYYSSDFNIGQSDELFLSQMNKVHNLSLNGKRTDIPKLYKLFGRDMNSTFTENGGTLLHWAIDKAYGAFDQLYYPGYNNNVEYFQMSVDPSIPDASGKTAIAYLKSKAGDFKKKGTATSSKTGKYAYDWLMEQLKALE